MERNFGLLWALLSVTVVVAAAACAGGEVSVGPEDTGGFALPDVGSHGDGGKDAGHADDGGEGDAGYQGDGGPDAGVLELRRGLAEPLDVIGLRGR